MNFNPKDLKLGTIAEFKLVLDDKTYIGRIDHIATPWPLDKSLYDFVPSLAYHDRFCWSLTDKMGLGEVFSTGIENSINIIEPAP